jgi:hypothetical protein
MCCDACEQNERCTMRDARCAVYRRGDHAALVCMAHSEFTNATRQSPPRNSASRLKYNALDTTWPPLHLCCTPLRQHQHHLCSARLRVTQSRPSAVAQLPQQPLLRSRQRQQAVLHLQEVGAHILQLLQAPLSVTGLYTWCSTCGDETAHVVSVRQRQHDSDCRRTGVIRTGVFTCFVKTCR